MKRTNVVSSELLYYWKGSVTGWRKDVHLGEDGKLQDPQIDAIHTAFAEQIGRNISLYEDEFQNVFVAFNASVERVGQLTTKLTNLEKEYDNRIERYKCLIERDFVTPNEQIRAKRSYDNILKITEDSMGLSGLRQELIAENNACEQHRIQLTEGFKLVQVENSVLLNKYNGLILHYLRGIKSAAPSAQINEQSDALITKEELQSFEESYMELHRSIFEN